MKLKTLNEDLIPYDSPQAQAMRAEVQARRVNLAARAIIAGRKTLSGAVGPISHVGYREAIVARLGELGYRLAANKQTVLAIAKTRTKTTATKKVAGPKTSTATKRRTTSP